MFNNYRRNYDVFKKLPLITFCLITIVGVIMFLLDEYIGFTDYPLMWVFIGGGSGVLSAFLTGVFISPIVLVTDCKLKESDRNT